MKVLAINGSSRPFGNNYNILKSCLDSFNKNNHDTELIQLSDLEIKGCKSCYTCKDGDNQCIIKDDMCLLIKNIMESNLLIVSSPLYMWQISANTKLFMERLYPAYHFDKPSDLKGKKLILLFTQATPNIKMFQPYFEHIKASMVFLGFDVVEMIVVPGLRKPNDYTTHPDILNKIADLGNKDWKL